MNVLGHTVNRTVLICVSAFFGIVFCTLAADEMCLIPAGNFVMGSNEEMPNESPADKIYLDAYYIDKTEVTNAEYHRFWVALGDKQSEHTPISYGNEFGTWPDIARTRANYPVVGISWYSAVAYAAWIGKRLPTEAEWEKASRGTDARRWPWGSRFAQRIQAQTLHANVWRGKDGFAGLSPVGHYPTGASPYGAYDMAGNVWEWVSDWYSDTYYHRRDARNPMGPRIGSRRVVRGGSWLNREGLARCSTRIGHYPELGTSFIGFRLAKDVER